MATFFNLNNHAPFFLRKGCKENCYSKKRIFHKYIGLPKHILTDFHDRITYVEEDYEIIPGVYLIPHKTPNLKLIGKCERMYRREHHQWIYDNFSHEQSLVFRTEKGLVIFNSCCHGGVGNIIHEVEKTFPTEQVYGIIGGFHLFNKSDEEIEAVLAKADELVNWAGDVKEYALQQALSGKQWDGWKLVEGRSNRRYVSEEAVAAKVEEAGFDPYEKKLLGITAMTKQLGKKRFEELLSDLVEKPQGKPVLVPESDKRPVMHTAADDFNDEK